MRPLTWLTSWSAPVALIGGWLLAGSRQPANYDAARDTISALAARGAHDRWIMTLALVLLGLCHLGTAWGLTDAGRAARLTLAIGGVGTLLVALFAQPSSGHVPSATVSFTALALWAALVGRPIRRLGVVLSIGLVVLLIWLGFELDAGALLGLSERVLAGAEAFAPAIVVLAVRRSTRAPSTHGVY